MRWSPCWVAVAIALALASCGGGELEAQSAAPVEATSTGCGEALGSEGGELTVTVDGAERDVLVHVPPPPRARCSHCPS